MSRITLPSSLDIAYFLTTLSHHRWISLTCSHESVPKYVDSRNYKTCVQLFEEVHSNDDDAIAEVNLLHELCIARSRQIKICCLTVG
eukprot:scaffold15755_cov97-Skeletonema_dohrnii-CCMP3373.AAC.4